jgi:glutamate decarboxylase
MTAIWVARNQVFPASAEFKGVEPEGLRVALRFYGWRDAVVLG